MRNETYYAKKFQDFTKIFQALATLMVTA